MLLSHFANNQWMYWQMLLPSGCLWLMFLAIVADVKATVFLLFVENHNLLNCLVVADVMATLWIG